MPSARTALWLSFPSAHRHYRGSSQLVYHLTRPSPLTIVGARAPLQSAWLKGDELLLFHQSGQARLWDIETGQLRRSMSRFTALDLLQTPSAWSQLFSSVATPHSLSFNLRQLINDGSPAWARQGSQAAASSTGIQQALDIIRYVLGRVWTVGIKPDLDVECADKLGLQLDEPIACALRYALKRVRD